MIAKLQLLALFSLPVLYGCQPIREWRYQELTDVAQQFFLAAAAGDSSAMEELVAREQPIIWVATARHLEPELLGSGAERLIPIRGSISADVAGVTYQIRGAEGNETLVVFFTRSDSGWRIVQVDLPDRH